MFRAGFLHVLINSSIKLGSVGPLITHTHSESIPDLFGQMIFAAFTWHGNTSLPTRSSWKLKVFRFEKLT